MTVSTFLDKISLLQSGGEGVFPPGLFPAYRSNSRLAYRRPDTNLFFSVISAFTLKTISACLQDSRDVETVEKIVARVTARYPDFRNKDGLNTYNFWRTKPSDHFSNGYLFRYFNHFKLPDDADDTVMVYLTGSPNEEELIWLKHKLAQHANGTKRWVKNTYPEYAGLKAYSTWFGKKMYIELDVCVLSNVLYGIYHYKLPFNQHDQDSLVYIRSVIESGRYKTDPFHCSHQYPRTALIIYHVARLMAAFEPFLLRRVRDELVETCQSLLETDIHPMDRVLLATSLLRLGRKSDPVPVGHYTADDFKGFWFFIAGLLTAYEYKWLYRIAPSGLFHMYWECEAHCWTLLAEYAVLRDAL